MNTENPSTTTSFATTPSAGHSQPVQALEQFTTAEIITAIGQRIEAAGGLLRLALAEADPATLTRQDRAALVDFLEKAMDARECATDTVR